jgi:threonine dehydrogenase-like Zn-dependent dehydrogenase
MVRGRTTAPEGLVLGHEITGEIVEKGRDVEFLNEGDLVSVRSTSPADGAAIARSARPGSA